MPAVLQERRAFQVRNEQALPIKEPSDTSITVEGGFLLQYDEGEGIYKIPLYYLGPYLDEENHPYLIRTYGGDVVVGEDGVRRLKHGGYYQDTIWLDTSTKIVLGERTARASMRAKCK